MLHLNSCWKKLQSAAVDDFWVFANQQDEVRKILMLAYEVPGEELAILEQVDIQ
jgi:hypothetical protein